MIEILILDDDNLCIDINKACVSRFAEKLKVAINTHCYNNVNSEITDLLRRVKIDIAVLDIDLENTYMNGFKIAEIVLKKNPLAIVIFVTSHSEYALDAFNIMAFGYLSKPVQPDKFEQIFRKALVQITGIGTIKNNHVIEVTSNRENCILKENSILYIMKFSQSVEITTKKETFIVYGTLKEIEGKLSSAFLKISASIIVNKSKIDKICGKTLVMLDGKELQIAIRKYKDVIREYREYLEY
ncbi:LytR/AlgR family response regulator transcription factor [Anaeromicropila populeti]|uniref:Stage 0 sporulation protein A homolog n=1 Tax=Anaeromicropila populeti TaxID=37658 RepID=A0A1I6LZR7_9FIRM|nr:LytTR family DNA-binding domain-containing protein [Anaeromicropila populeti]SFS08940.1 two component transcriptional regulator, LytTR family [Anaeromicropila populeti]